MSSKRKGIYREIRRYIQNYKSNILVFFFSYFCLCIISTNPKFLRNVYAFCLKVSFGINHSFSVWENYMYIVPVAEVSSAGVHVWCDMVMVSKLLFCFINKQFIIKTHSYDIQNIFNLTITSTNMVDMKTNEINNQELEL